MKFVIYNLSGEILSIGECPPGEMEAQRPPGALIMEGEADILADAVDVQSMQVLRGARPPQPVDMDYRKARASVYPPVQEQMDMLWKAMDASPDQRLEPFYGLIKAIKESYPKDNSVEPGSVIIYQAE